MSSTRRFTQFPEDTARQVIAGEEAVRASGLDWTIIRPSMIYGSRDDNNLVHLQRALKKWPIHPLPDGGRMKWQPVFTWDVVAALLAALDSADAVRRDYTIAGPEPITYAEMVRTMMREMKVRRLLVPIPLSFVRGAMGLMALVSKRPLLTSDQIDRLREDKVFDISDARRDLGFDPISFEEGINRKILGKV
jgi:nucleoside-diphosphate-sugar epimerase